MLSLSDAKANLFEVYRGEMIFIHVDKRNLICPLWWEIYVRVIYIRYL